MKKIFPLIAALSLSASPLVAQSIFSSPSDGTVDSGSVVDIGAFNAQAGQLVTDRAFVLPFLLPNLGAGSIFESADLRLMLFLRNALSGQNADVYGLARTSASPAISAADYFIGSMDASASLIQGDFFTPTSPTGVAINTDASGDSSLLSWLNGQYANGANAGQYVFLRVNSDVNPAGDFRYDILTFDAGAASERPLLSYTVTAVPEPGTVASAVLLAGLVGLRLRRSRKS